MDMSPPDWVILLAVAATTIVTTLMLPPRWGWKALPAVAAIVLAILLAATGCMFLVIGFYDQGGFLIHFGFRHWALIIVAFAITVLARRWRRRSR